MPRKLFAAGCRVLVATGLAHLLGHYSLIRAQGDTEAERQRPSLMRGNAQDLGLGFIRRGLTHEGPAGGWSDAGPRGLRPRFSRA